MKRVTGVAIALAFSACACPKPMPQEAAPPEPLGIADASVGFDVEDAGARDASEDAGTRAAQDDGNDDVEDPGEGAAPRTARFERVGIPPLALTRICDLTPFDDALYASHANQALGTDGATISRYRPSDEKRPFSVAFDWNRPNEPTKGGGAGQGFLRVRSIGGRLFVPDSDPPYNGLGLVEHGTEGYVFVSDRQGKFAPPRPPHFKPPAAPNLASEDAGAGAGVLPRAYHVLDVVRFNGKLYASTGSVPPNERAWRGPSPGALHRANDDGSRWTYEVGTPYPYKDGVYRLTFLVRFRGRLYAGYQDYDRREPIDYVYFAPHTNDAGAALTHDDMHAVRVTPGGAAATLRWWVDARANPARLYWIASGRDGVVLRVTTNGDDWKAIALPADAGAPTDVIRFRDAVVVLAENGLYRLRESDSSEVADLVAPAIEPSAGKRPRSPFELGDFMCAAPLAVFRNALYAGGQRGGILYRLAE